MTRLLHGFAPDLDEFLEATGILAEPKGTRLLKVKFSDHEVLISAWFAAKVTLMIDDDAKDILRNKLGLPMSTDEEE